MNLIRKYLTSNLYNKNMYIGCQFFNEFKMNRYYTCLSSCNFNRKVIKYECSGKQIRKSSLLQFVLDTNYKVATKTRELTESLKWVVPTKKFKYDKLGALWYKTLDEVNVQDFFDVFEMEDTFFSRFKIIELHVWMLLYHLPKTDRSWEYVRTGLIKAMWEDCEKRARIVGPHNIEHKKNFKLMYGKFVLSQLLYDDGFNKDDTFLANSVWCSFFNKKNVDPRLLEAMVSYIRYQMSHLNRLNVEQLNEQEEKSNIWAPVKPHFKALLGK